MADQPNSSPLLAESEFKALDLCDELAGALAEMISEGAAELGGPDQTLNQLAWSQMLNPHIWALRPIVMAWHERE